eukprot:TRINITY_DN13410_c0_g1_i1.p1 TRINITY_DN13410_c0_g1~~TRINITY_DN13410_c0_g1_i1.p1  ORF type:complete len:143 (-),score=37.92 TRINITY_DN13410_c0_g1_i1:68-496(-)
MLLSRSPLLSSKIQSVQLRRNTLRRTQVRRDFRTIEEVNHKLLTLKDVDDIQGVLEQMESDGILPTKETLKICVKLHSDKYKAMSASEKMNIHKIAPKFATLPPDLQTAVDESLEYTDSRLDLTQDEWIGDDYVDQNVKDPN